MNRSVLNRLRGELASDIRQLWSGTVQYIRAHRRAYLLGLLLVTAVILYLWPHDRIITDMLTADRTRSVLRTARIWRRWCAFIDTLVLTGLLYVAGLLLQRRTLRRLAVCAFMAAALSGLTANSLRLTTGRPRPRAGVPDGFNGPIPEFDFQSFPSGHTATTGGFSAAVFVASPALGILPLVNTAGVTWASFYTRNHYSSDLVLALAFALGWGIPLGQTVRRLNHAETGADDVK